MTGLTPEQRTTLIVSKGKQIRELQMELARLVATCSHKVVSSHKPMLTLPDNPEYAQDRMTLEEVFNKVEKKAQKENRTVTNMVETILLEATEK